MNLLGAPVITPITLLSAAMKEKVQRLRVGHLVTLEAACAATFLLGLLLATAGLGRTGPLTMSGTALTEAELMQRLRAGNAGQQSDHRAIFSVSARGAGTTKRPAQ